ncbi:MAG: iron chelate uptake ABC transporter family permease subunit [Phycisphaerales bacterium JB061]
MTADTTSLLGILQKTIVELPKLFAGQASNTTVVVVASGLFGVAAGLVGVFALLRKRSLTADAIGHATLPGVAGAFIVGTMLGLPVREGPWLLVGAAIAGALGAWMIQLIAHRTRLGEDAAIGIVLSVFFGVGVVLLGVVQNMESGTQGGLSTFIFGHTASMLAADARAMGLIALFVLIVTFVLRKQLTLVCFNDTYARATGWPVQFVDLLLLGLIIVVSVAGLRAVGLLLVVAMITIPPAAARFWSDHLGKIVLVSALIGGVSGSVGAAMSALAPGRPAGAVIVLTAGVFFAISMLCAPRRGVLAGGIGRVRSRVRILSDHTIETLWEHSEEGSSPDMGPVRDLPGGLRGRLVFLLLRLQGAVRPAGDTYALTEKGQAEGARLSRNHRLWSAYLTTHAEVAPSHVDWSVDQVEHVLSDELVQKLERIVELEDARA